MLFYKPEEGHGLPHNPFNALVAPRPIGWISSIDDNGRANLAPYSFFNAVAYTPPQIMYASTGAHADGGLKDSLKNILATGEFVINIVPAGLMDKMNLSSVAAPQGIDEFELAGLTKAASRCVLPPRVAESPAQLECRFTQKVTLKTRTPESPNILILAEVVGVHIRDDILQNGMVDIAKMQPLCRLGYQEYAIVNQSFTMSRPAWPIDLDSGNISESS